MELKGNGIFPGKVMAPIAVAIIALTVFFGCYAWRIFRQETLNRYRSETVFFAGVATDAIKTGDDISVLTILHNFKKHSPLAFARVIGADNTVRISLDPGENGMIAGPDSGIPGRVRGVDAHGARYRFIAPDEKLPAGVHEYSDVLVNPLSGSECGLVRVGFSGEEIRSGGRRIAAHAAIAGAVSLAIAGFLAWLAARRVKK